MTGRIVLVSGTTDEPLTLLEVKQWIKREEDDTSEDEVIAALLTTARQRYEQYTHRVGLQQTFDYVLDEAPYECVELPRFPLVSVTSITGFTDSDLTDTGGTAMSSTGYYVDTASEPGRVVAIGTAFPAASRTVNGTIIRFVAGHSTSSTGVPEQMKTTIKSMIAAASEFRGDQDQKDAMDNVLADEFLVPEWG